jgi:type IV pilus biogenesis protein CpaD/CtpE
MNRIVPRGLEVFKKVHLIVLLCFCFVCSGCRDQDQKLVPLGFWKEKAERLSKHEEISFHSKSSILAASEKKKILKLLEATDVKIPVYVRLQTYHSHSPQSAKLAQKRTTSLKTYLITQGIKSENIQINVFNTSGMGERKGEKGEAIILIIDQYRMLIPKCPGYESITTDASAHGEKELGCSVTANLSKMIVNPKDVYEAGATAPGDAAYETAAIERYRTDKIKQLQSTGTTEGANTGLSAGGNAS